MPPKKKLRTEATWEYEVDGKWSFYDATDAAMLESEYAKAKGTGTVNTTNFTFNQGYNTVYTIDFSAMKQTNTASGTSRPIRRVAAFGEICWEYIGDLGVFVGFYDEDTNTIEQLYRDHGINKGKAAAKTKKLSWNKGYNSVYAYTFESEKLDPNTKTVVEVIGTQTNEDSGKVRQIRRTPKKLPWDVEGYGISGDKDALHTLQQMAAAAAAAAPVAAAAAAASAVAVATAVAATPAPSATAVAAPTPTHTHTPAPAPAPAPAAVAEGPSLNALIKAPTLSLPQYWEKAKMFDAVGGVHEVKLNPSSDEFKRIEADVLATIGIKVNVVHIIRLENAALYSFYAMTRMMIANGESKLLIGAGGKGSTETANEKMLYTGERIEKNMVAIKKFGFDTRVAPKDGKLGQGLYFSTKASYPNNGLCIQNPDGSKDLFVCRVAVGAVAKGEHGIRRPPPLDPKQPKMALYDSCADDPKNPQTFVIFNNKQVYPEYIVRYI